MREFSNDDEKDDQGRDPRPEFVHMDNLVAEDNDEEGAESDNEDSHPTRNVMVDGMDKLCTDNDVDRGPAYTRKNVETRN